MARVNKNNYIERTSVGCGRFQNRKVKVWRDWWLGKYTGINLTIKVPKRLMGKRFKIKIEEIN